MAKSRASQQPLETEYELQNDWAEQGHEGQEGNGKGIKRQSVKEVVLGKEAAK